jgi:hypothetical protein
MSNVSGFNIYRETSSFNQFELVHTQPLAHHSTFIDNAASTVDKPWRYYIAYYDACGESYGSGIHKTIDIVVESIVVASYNLSWDDYEGIEYTSIDLKRFDPATGLWETIQNLPIGTSTYTDVPTGIQTPEYLI